MSQSIDHLQQVTDRIERQMSGLMDKRLSRSFQVQMGNSLAIGLSVLNVVILLLHLASIAVFWMGARDDLSEIKNEQKTLMTWIQTTRERVQKLENDK